MAVNFAVCAVIGIVIICIAGAAAVWAWMIAISTHSLTYAACVSLGLIIIVLTLFVLYWMIDRQREAPAV